MWEKLVADFYFNFIEDNRWKYITDGLQNTLKITFFAVLIGIVLGFLVAIIRSTYENTHKLKILNAVCTVYLTVIRGTPVVVQLMIVYFVIFVAINPGMVLLKETSVAGYIGLQDLTKGGDIIKSRTYSAFMPLIAVALIYLVMVMIFSYLVKLLERRLSRSEH